MSLLLAMRPPMTDTNPTPVVHLASLALTQGTDRGDFAGAFHRIGDPLALTKLGASYLEVPPGKSACPCHVHHAVDEMFVILAGEGEYRFGDRSHPVAAGDVLGAPRGNLDYAHKLTNTGTTTLKYLAISSVADADICEYPDSGKFAAGSEIGFGFIGRAEETRNYWEGEIDDTP